MRNRIVSQTAREPKVWTRFSGASPLPPRRSRLPEPLDQSREERREARIHPEMAAVELRVLEGHIELREPPSEATQRKLQVKLVAPARFQVEPLEGSERLPVRRTGV